MKFQKSVLKNGLRVITAPMREVESISLAVFIGVGSRYEKKSQNGISHFLEHLIFKGSKKYPSPLYISRTIEGMGGVLNGWTDVESTVFWTKVPAVHLQEGADVLFDIVLRPLLEESSLERERGVVLEEINRRFDAPEDYVFELFMQTTFPNQPLGRSILGKRDTVEALSRRDFLNYLKRYYQPWKMLVVASGKVSHGELLDLVRTFFSGSWPFLKAAPSKAAPRQVKPRFCLHYKETEQAHLRLGFWGLSNFSEERFVLTVINAILGQGMSSRLFTKVREELGLAYSIGTYGELYRDTGVFLVRAGLSLSKVTKAVKIILGELKRLRIEPVKAEELAEAKEKIKGPLLFKLESSDQIVQFLGVQELLTPRILTPKEVVKRVEAVGARDIQRVARKLFTPQRLNAALIGPFKSEAPFLSLFRSRSATAL